MRVYNKMPSINLEVAISYRLKCLASADEYIAFTTEMEGKQKVVLCTFGQNNQISYKFFTCVDESVN
jgi:hypothetical protein